jgi:hypothetical protein
MARSSNRGWIVGIEDDDDVDDPEVSMGLLMEIAQSHQQLAEASLESLKEHAAGLDAVVREQIRRTLIAELRGVHVEAERAASSLRRVQKAADLRIVAWSIGIAVLSALIAAAVALGTVHVLKGLLSAAMPSHR